ncbi:MAG: hypothetical protein O7B99_06205 [Planctomycetota bacterium]|nr:hypothetical protein [Planctomycetota bacterium]
MTETQDRFPSFAAALRELDGVHRAELALLLGRAADLRAHDAPFAICAGLPSGSDSFSAWCAAARRELELLLADGLEDEAALLAELVRTDPCLWPAASLLAELALVLRPDGSGGSGGRGRIVLGRALLAEGETVSALRVFGEGLRRGPADERWQACAGIGRAHELRGGDRLALGAFEAAAGQPTCGVAPQVASLFLSLALGERQRARRAAARLARDVHPRDPELRGELEGLRLRIELLRGGLPWMPARATASVFARLAGAGTAAAEVCHALAQEARADG